MTTPIALTIAGSDSSGGAGIQADLKTFAAFGVFGASVITALTAQNTTGVSGIHQVPAEFVTAQIDAVFSDLAVGAVKIGMVSQRGVIETIAAGRGIRDLPRLRRLYGKGRWRKMKGSARICLRDGRIRLAELHWYEAHGIGKKEFKRKRYID